MQLGVPAPPQSSIIKAAMHCSLRRCWRHRGASWPRSRRCWGAAAPATTKTATAHRTPRTAAPPQRCAARTMPCSATCRSLAGCWQTAAPPPAHPAAAAPAAPCPSLSPTAAPAALGTRPPPAAMSSPRLSWQRRQREELEQGLTQSSAPPTTTSPSTTGSCRACSSSSRCVHAWAVVVVGGGGGGRAASCARFHPNSML